MTTPSSMTRLVLASRNATLATKPAPLAKSDLVVARAAKLHDDETKPKKVASETSRRPSPPMARRIRSCVTNTWMRLDTR